MKHIKKFNEINELHKGTWQRASNAAHDKGLKNLSKKFDEWGDSFGTGSAFPIKLVYVLIDEKTGDVKTPDDFRFFNVKDDGIEDDDIIIYPFIKLTAEKETVPFLKGDETNIYIAKKMISPGGNFSYPKIYAEVNDNMNKIEINGKNYKCKDRISANNLIKSLSDPILLHRPANIDPKKLIYGY
jgi:hypothetical protein